MAHKQKARTFEVLIEQLEALARSKPVLMLLEDAHYLDPTSAELFDQVVDRIQRLPILLIAASRPEGAVRWNGLPHATFLSLNRLSRAQAASIIGAMTGGKQLPAALLDQILSKTEGVPLFVEELTKVVLESGLLRESAGPAYSGRPTASARRPCHPARLSDGAARSVGLRHAKSRRWARLSGANSRMNCLPRPRVFLKLSLSVQRTSSLRPDLFSAVAPAARQATHSSMRLCRMPRTAACSSAVANNSMRGSLASSRSVFPRS